MALKVTKEGMHIGEVAQVQLNRAAAEDLKRVEEAAKHEAEEYVAAVDGDGNEKASVEAAETAFDFDMAEIETEDCQESSEERINADKRFGPRGW